MIDNANASDGKISEILGVVLIAISILIAISLIPHDVTDGNWAGKAGEYISSLALRGVGYAAFALPLFFLIWGWDRLRRTDAAESLIKTLALLLIITLYCGAAGLASGANEDVGAVLGGWLGLNLSTKVLLPYLGKGGSYVLIAAFFLVTVVAATRISLSKIIASLSDKITAKGEVFGTRIKNRRSKQKDGKSKSNRSGRSTEPNKESNNAKGSPTVKVKRKSVASPQVIEYHEPEIVDPLDDSEERPPRAEIPDPEGYEDEEIIYEYPPSLLLEDPPEEKGSPKREELMKSAAVVEKGLFNFGIDGKVVQVTPGPVITRYEVEPAPGVKVNRIVSLADDLALVMKAKRIRIQAPIPGKAAVGIEVPNQEPSVVYLKEIVESDEFRESTSKTLFALGKTTWGEPYCVDLVKMPHLLIAGATGSGKSMCINVLINSLLFRATSEEIRLILVDPKVLELSVYNDIPHLLTPVVTDPQRASEALKWAVAEMETRYHNMSKLGVRNIDDYNRKVERLLPPAESREDDDVPPRMPYIVIIIDELADLMLTASRDIEDSIARLAQMARAIGIHLILATQRPSVNIITGVIKANFPARIAFQVASKVDSRTILDSNGAESLLGSGDMLFIPPGQHELVRIHGAYISTEEVDRVAEAIKVQKIKAEEVEIFDEQGEAITGGVRGDRDELFKDAARLIILHQQGSTSFLQRRLKVGFSRAGRIMDELEAAGIVGPADGSKAREVLVDDSYLEELEMVDDE